MKQSRAPPPTAETKPGGVGRVKAGAGGFEPPTSRLTGGAVGSLGPTLHWHLADGSRESAGLVPFPHDAKAVPVDTIIRTLESPATPPTARVSSNHSVAKAPDSGF